MGLVAKVALELLEKDPSFIIYSIQNPLKEPMLRVFKHQSLLLWRVIVSNPIRTLVGDEIGLGKTIEASEIMWYLKKRGACKFLLLLPKILIPQWRSELKRFFSEIEIHILNQRNIGGYASARFKPGYYLISIDLAKRDKYKHYLKSVKWDVVVIDEAHNLGGDGLRDKLLEELEFEHALMLSATPHRGKSKRYLRVLSHLDNSISEEKYKQLDSRDFYMRTHNCLIHRRTKNLVNQLEDEPIFPRCDVIAVIAESTEDEKKFSNEIVDFLRELLATSNNELPVGLLAAILRKRVSSSPRAAINTLEKIVGSVSGESTDIRIAEKIMGESYEELGEVAEELGMEEADADEILDRVVEAYGGKLEERHIRRLAKFLEMARKLEEKDSKIETLKDIINYHIERGEKVIVFTEYKDTLRYLAEKLKEFEPVTIYGGMEKEWEQRIKEFVESERKNVLIATDVASEGLNLQVANVIINYEPPWTPVKLEQRMGRAWRLGQTKDVFVYNLFLSTKADMEIASILYGKLLNIKEALHDVKNTLGEHVHVAHKREITSSEEIIDPSTIPPEITYTTKTGRRRKRNFTELQIALAHLSGELDEFVTEIGRQIEELRREIREKRIYPFEAVQLLKNLTEKFGCASAKKIEKLLVHVAKIEADKECKPTEVKRTIEEFAKRWPRYLVVQDSKESIDFIMIAKVDFDSHSIEIPLAYSDGKLLFGAKLLEYVIDVVSRAIEPNDVYSRQAIEPNEGRIKYLLQDCLQSILKSYKEYSNFDNIGKMWRDFGIKDIKLEVISTILRVPEFSSETVDENYRQKVGHEGEKFAEEYEKSRGYEVEHRQTLMIYDLYSYFPSEKDMREGERPNERYIEVKAHGKGSKFVTLTEGEFHFGKEMGEKYWLYLIYNVLSDNPILIALQDPFNKHKLKVTKDREEIVVIREIYKVSLG